MDRFVICMKWGSKYGPEYVNRLYGMVARHLNDSWNPASVYPVYPP